MGFLDRLLGRSTAPRTTTLQATVFPGRETLEVVGEAQHQDELWEIVGGFRLDRVRHDCHALLLPEPNNPVDPNAIRVLVNGQPIGYLSREDAAAYLPGLLRLMGSCETGHVALDGVICGGGQRPDGIGFLGVFLDHNPADFGLANHHVTSGLMRTGLSAAIATDLEDDSYDLSWLNTLPADDDQAIARLRTLLNDEDEPIDRHYMLSELEHRLYHCRAIRPTSLDEFDAVCVQHHGEMTTLRPALLAKFGAVPVIEMYRQASIRCQKAKRWEDARQWAQSGLDIYGNQAARQDVVDDLHKRAEHATAKLDERATPRPQRPRQVRVATPKTGEIETLVCSSCGESFERIITRGRKPKLCPTCRGQEATEAVAALTDP